MATTFLWSLQNFWPFTWFKNDDLRISKQLVSKLSVPDCTKQFVYAFRDPETQSVIYILSALNLSERSCLDVECLIREIRPDAVVVQTDLQCEEIELEDGIDDAPLPTSPFGVIKRCFVDKIGREKYENEAGNLVLREIFGTSFQGHLSVAKRAAEEVGSSFFMLQSPLGTLSRGNVSCEGDTGNHSKTLVSTLVPQRSVSPASMTLKRIFLGNDVQLQMLKSFSVYMDPPMLGHTSSVSMGDSEEIQPSLDYETPSFAKSIYPLLEDLHNAFVDLPSIGKALAHVQKMLLDVNKGEVLDTRIVSEVYWFRIAVECLRIVLHNGSLKRINRNANSNSDKIDFSKLPVEDKSYAVFAQALRCQTDKFKTIVAVVDAGDLGGVRKHWDTPLPPEVKELVGQLFANSEGEGIVSNQKGWKELFTEKTVVSVGAGATAVLGVSSLTKVAPASTFMKAVPLRLPALFQLFLSQIQKAMLFSFGPSKVAASGFAGSGAKTSGILKATLSAEKIRAVTHSVIASVEKTSISAMRTALYEIMRNRKVRPVGFLPWVTVASSMGTCTGLLLYGDRIECAVESLPAAPSIANLGLGIRHLREASQAVMQTEGARIQISIESLINRLKKAKNL
ncbi:hypothetical protein L6164_001507 [Bauhinia variegata]|uniref:Uncharacterized protein n=1 Tax=Bauhinia variegata TaxID=167791 RepID=A0ACB9Q9V6_BAUVA|nr:hypothetical protein L6164_001507 [Bauhinia variegata]